MMQQNWGQSPVKVKKLCQQSLTSDDTILESCPTNQSIIPTFSSRSTLKDTKVASQTVNANRTPVSSSAIGCAILLFLISACNGIIVADRVTYGHRGSAFSEIGCRGRYDSSIFAKMNRICEDCYDLYREPLLYTLCRYILYDVNPPEGFNLRRDVYVRVAVFIHNLNQADDAYEWNLVLPPWDHLYHWRSQDIGIQSQIPWNKFFDISSLRKFIPVLDMFEFLRDYDSRNGKTILDKVFVLQNDLAMFDTGIFHDKNEIIECDDSRIRVRNKKMASRFWGYMNVTSQNIQCILFHGTMQNLAQNLEPKAYKTYAFEHMEIPLHDHYGSRDVWKARRSMRYHPELYEIAKEFRKTFLNSTDDNDKTEKPEDWREQKHQRNAIGGPYLGIHLRRRDFLIGRKDSVPSIKNAALQVIEKINALGLKTIFIATDAEDHEFQELEERLRSYTVVRYVPTHDVKLKFKDGGVAIIDQIICSHARHFIGTYESTFTFRIQEEREIMGFPEKSTFNIFCKAKEKCSPGSQWKITW